MLNENFIITLFSTWSIIIVTVTALRHGDISSHNHVTFLSRLNNTVVIHILVLQVIATSLFRRCLFKACSTIVSLMVRFKFIVKTLTKKGEVGNCNLNNQLLSKATNQTGPS